MEKGELAEWVNKLVIVQGELQRTLIWLSRLNTDIEILKKKMLTSEKENGE